MTHRFSSRHLVFRECPRLEAWERQAERDDEQLAEAEVIRLARLEQQRRPADLLQVA
jgi:hypothetical protein